MPSILQLTLTLLASAVAGVLAFRVLRLPPILGYLAVGVLIGPHALGFVSDDSTVKDFAEFGVVFLMFSIGLEFSLTKLRAMRKIVFGFGASQVFLTMVLTIPAGYFLRFILPLPLPWHVLLALGGALAMSSTAIVIKLLAERSELDSAHGKNAVGVLLFQDLVVILLLILIPSLGKNPGDTLQVLGLASIKIIVALGLIFVFGQKIFSFWFKLVASLRSQELFMLNLLLVALGMAALTESLGLSMALGAFIAGMLISETPYRYQVEEGIASFRDVMLGLFFITVGMLVDFGVIYRNAPLVLLLLIGPLILKFGIITTLAKRFGASPGVAIRTGLCLTQAGEFGFVLLQQIDGLDWIEPDLLQAVLAAMLISMLISPILIQFSDKIALRFSSNEWLNQSLNLTKIASLSVRNDNHVIICGFGRSGQNLASMLDLEKIKYIALDLDPDRVQDAAEAGSSVVYGDAQKAPALNAAGIARAKAVVVTFNHTPTAMRVLNQVELLKPGLPVLVRTDDDADLEKLQNAGATEVIPELIEGSLMLASHVLLVVGVPMRRVVRRITEAREQRYGLLRGYFRSIEDEESSPGESLRLHSVRLDVDAAGIGKALEILASTGAQVQALRRRDAVTKLYKKIDFSADTQIELGDVLVLQGNVEAIEKAERLLI
jgi:CPA2 family monovalent cation:H+ antiporter-2